MKSKSTKPTGQPEWQEGPKLICPICLKNGCEHDHSRPTKKEVKTKDKTRKKKIKKTVKKEREALKRVMNYIETY
jgi:hypothetical protein